MARPSAEVIAKIEDVNGVTWEIIDTDTVYIITYKGRPTGVRSHHFVSFGLQYKYKRMLYGNEGNAKLEVERLNKRFKTDLFSYIAIGE